jgi:hypothetical protein
MPVRADNRQGLYARIQRQGNLARAGFGWKQAVFVEQHGSDSTFFSNFA